MNEWFMTDDSCLQHCRQIPDRTPNYGFVQINCFPGSADNKPFYQIAHGNVRVLSDYSEEEIHSALVSYGYSDVDDFVLRNSADAKPVYRSDGSLDRENTPGYEVNYQLIAEMLFESDNQEFVVNEFSTWNDAVRAVSEITGLDLSRYLDKDLYLFTEELPDKGVIKHILTDQDMNAESFGRQVPGSTSKVSLHYPVAAAACIADYIGKAPPNDAPVHISPDGKRQLSSLIQPIIDANIGRDVHMHPMIAIKWGFEHMDYVRDLDLIYNKLGLLDVQRYRSSVTQGEAGVICNGKEIARFGDDIKLRSNGSHEIFSSLTTNEPQYGEVIGGWGSINPDEKFRRAALTQYGKEICKALAAEKSLDELIASAEAKGATPAESRNYTRDFEL